MNMPDGNTAALRMREAQESRNELAHEAAEAMAKQQSAYDVCDADVVRDLIHEDEIDPSTCLARCFKELDKACRGDLIARDAITAALHYLRRDMLYVREKNIYDDCRERVRDV